MVRRLVVRTETRRRTVRPGHIATTPARTEARRARERAVVFDDYAIPALEF